MSTAASGLALWLFQAVLLDELQVLTVAAGQDSSLLSHPGLSWVNPSVQLPKPAVPARSKDCDSEEEAQKGVRAGIIPLGRRPCVMVIYLL